MGKRGDGAYYYAGGEKVVLLPADDLVAVDADHAPRVAKSVQPIGRALTEGLRLISTDELDAADAADAAAAAKSKYPVFRAHGALIVALPEVRVEESRPTHRAKLDRWLEAHRDEVTVVSRADERIVLEPASGSGEDALALANALAEQVRPEMAQARFIRVVPRPGSR